MDREDIKENMTVSETWVRGVFMLLFALCYYIAKVLLIAITVVQFLSTLITGGTQPRLLTLGKSLSDYVYQIYLFLTYNSEERPFPFSPWPGEEVAPPAAKTSKKKASKKKAVKKKAVAQEKEPDVEDDDDEDDEAHLGV